MKKVIEKINYKHPHNYTIRDIFIDLRSLREISRFRVRISTSTNKHLQQRILQNEMQPKFFNSLRTRAIRRKISKPSTHVNKIFDSAVHIDRIVRLTGKIWFWMQQRISFRPQCENSKARKRRKYFECFVLCWNMQRRNIWWLKKLLKNCRVLVPKRSHALSHNSNFIITKSHVAQVSNVRLF